VSIQYAHSEADNGNFSLMQDRRGLRGNIKGYQEDPLEKKLDDLMPINVTVTNSGKIALPELIKMLLFTLAVLRLNSKVCLFSLGLSRRIHAAHWSRIKLRIVWL